MVFVCVDKLEICCRSAPIDMSFSFNFTANSSSFAVKLKKSLCFRITSFISDKNRRGPYRKPLNKMTQSGAWAVKRIAVSKQKK